jgi:hypothetical protein
MFATDSDIVASSLELSVEMVPNDRHTSVHCIVTTNETAVRQWIAWVFGEVYDSNYSMCEHD